MYWEGRTRARLSLKTMTFTNLPFDHITRDKMFSSLMDLGIFLNRKDLFPTTPEPVVQFKESISCILQMLN